MPASPIPSDEHHVYFAIFGFSEDPHMLTLELGIEPDDIWREGEAFSEVMPEAKRRENRWILASGLGREASHRDHFEKLVLKLERIKDALVELGKKNYRFGIGVSRYYFMDDPDFYLPEELIQRYQELGFSISFDQLALDS